MMQSWLLACWLVGPVRANKTSRFLPLDLPSFLYFVSTWLRVWRKYVPRVATSLLFMRCACSAFISVLTSSRLGWASKSCKMSSSASVEFIYFHFFLEKLFCWLWVHNAALIVVVLPAWLLSIVSMRMLRISRLGHFDASDTTFRLSFFSRRRSFLGARVQLDFFPHYLRCT